MYVVSAFSRAYENTGRYHKKINTHSEEVEKQKYKIHVGSRVENNRRRVHAPMMMAEKKCMCLGTNCL